MGGGRGARGGTLPPHGQGMESQRQEGLSLEYYIWVLFTHITYARFIMVIFSHKKKTFIVLYICFAHSVWNYNEPTVHAVIILLIGCSHNRKGRNHSHWFKKWLIDNVSHVLQWRLEAYYTTELTKRFSFLLKDFSVRESAMEPGLSCVRNHNNRL